MEVRATSEEESVVPAPTGSVAEFVKQRRHLQESEGGGVFFSTLWCVADSQRGLIYARLHTTDSWRVGSSIG